MLFSLMFWVLVSLCSGVCFVLFGDHQQDSFHTVVQWCAHSYFITDFVLDKYSLFFTTLAEIYLFIWSSDCIGSAFNVKGAMQCPNCRKIEKGQWLYANGCRSLPEFSMEDWAHDEDLYDLSYSEMVNGFFSNEYFTFIRYKCMVVLMYWETI